MVKGKWAQGIVPRNFRWVLKDQLAVCERPGGYGENHRRVRREEEIIWIRQQGFTCVVSLIPSPHNLHNYEEHQLPYLHRPFPQHEEPHDYLARLYVELRELIRGGAKVLVHLEELGDVISGVVAGFLLWDELVPDGPRAISVTERLLERQLGPEARAIVSVSEHLPRAGDGDAPAVSDEVVALRDRAATGED